MPGVLSTLVGSPDPTLDQLNKFTGATPALGSFILFFTFLTQAVSNSALAANFPELAKRMGAFLAPLSDTGYILRLTGSFGVLAGLKRLEASDESDSVMLNLKRVQLLSNLVYFISENLSWLGGKGVISLDAATIGSHGLRAGRATLVNLLTTLVILYLDRQKMSAKGGEEAQKGLKMNTFGMVATACLVPIVLGGVRPDLKVLDGFQSGLAGMVTGYLGMRGQWAAAGAK